MISLVTKTAIATLLIGAILLRLNPDDTSSITVHLAGDSTMARQLESKRPGTGWGESLENLLCDRVQIINHAKNGQSTKSFLSDGLWARLTGKLEPGDVVLIQFGHNDQKADNARLFTEAGKAYKGNLRRFVADVRASEARPVLLTPIVRRFFDSQGRLSPTLGNYPAATRDVASELSVPLVDLNTKTHDVIQALGPSSSKSMFLHLPEDQFSNYIEGVQDDTHLNDTGAIKIATMAATELEQVMPSVFCVH